MSIETVFNIVLILSASALCVALIIYLSRITNSIKAIEESIKDLSSQFKPLIASTTSLSEKLNRISEKASEPVEAVNGIVSEIKDRVDQILEFEEKLRDGIERPASEILNTLAAVSNGVKTFWNAYLNKNR